MNHQTSVGLRIASVFALICLISNAETATITAGDLSAGAARIDITPEMGVSLDGSISKNGVVESIHDRLHARALVLDDGKTRIAMVIVDNCMTSRDVFDKAKASVHQATGFPIDHMLMASTHTHAAPRTAHISREPIDDRYHDQVSDGISRAILAAIENLRPAQIGYASFDRPSLIACRRFICEPGTVEANPFGELGEQIKSVAGRSSGVIGPAGPVDPQFSILSVRHRDQTPLCVLGNFSVHYCGGYQRGAVSADYFGFFSREIESLLKHDSAHPPVVGIMSNGTSGNTGAFQRSDGKKFKPFEGMQHYGRMLASETRQLLDEIEYRSDVSIGMLQQQLTLGVRRPSEERLAWATKTIGQPKAEHTHRWSLIYAQEAQHLSKYPSEKTIVLQAIRIGDIGIAAAPCEVFAETGLGIKSASPFRHTFSIELANGYGGYLPTLEQHQLGGYETWPARSSFLEKNAEQKIRSTLVDSLQQLDGEP
tara:strand:+ start:422101 stop:423549 length:1449 start_codon:yes stop_codon:yes gene_type:complete